ncbi:MAG: hypothetical protein ABJF50_15640 [Paracoccaceae bacterium]
MMRGDGDAVARSYFDAAYYLKQTKGEGQSDPFAHYLSKGAAKGLSPCAYFEQDWYGWQNPDHRVSHDNCFFHYLDVGRHEGRDPSPLVDMVALIESLGAGLDPVAVSDAVLRMRSPKGCGVYANFEELERQQKQFCDAVRPSLIRNTLALDRRKNLVIVQAGKSGTHHRWFDEIADRNWDLCLNLYDASDARLAGGEFIVAQSGTKATAMAMFASTLNHILRGYDFVMFLDDDVTVDMASLERAFEACATHNLDAAQMSLSARSNCVWPIFFSTGGAGVRYTNGVEIMMPILSARCFEACRDLFGRSVSGFGLDLAIGQRANSLGHRNVGILDDCVAEHLRPIDAKGGALYSYLRSVGINPKAELWHLKQAQDMPEIFAEV